VCAHAQHEGCACRKPKPGMLLDAAKRHGIDLRASFMVGDRRGDVEAGAAAGCRTVFVDRGYAEPPAATPDARAAGIADAADAILALSRNNIPMEQAT
jgi:D-glycero-D-manno-heptose 1,7-bisphosphate phosphatase